MSIPSTYKPSPLSFNSPRTSPFRRPESPAASSPSSTIRPTTPIHLSTRPTTPSKLREATSPDTTETPDASASAWTPRGQNLSTARAREPPASPTRNGSGDTGGKAEETDVFSSPVRGGMARDLGMPVSKPTTSDALARLPAAQVREMREAYQILDRDNDGQVNREDVADMLGSLGLDNSGPALTPFFPPSRPQTLTLPAYLSSLSSLLAPLSPPSELLAAFDAFDDDDSGQIDVADLRDALLHTSPEVGEKPMSEKELNAAMEGWVGRRAFGKGLSGGGLKGKGDVFRYREWVAGLGSAGDGGKKAQVAQ